MKKKWLLLGLIAVVGGTVYAEPIRTVLTKENRLPRLYQAEVGAEFYYVEREDADETAAIPYLRYTIARDLAVVGTLPYRSVDPDDPMLKKKSGLGDATVGVEWIAYKNLFDYPWIMPHAQVSFDTGDEDKGLGAGDTEYMIGIAIGVTVNREFHFVADARYQILDQRDNIPSIAGSIVWDLDQSFSLIAEIELSREKDAADVFGVRDDRHPLIFLAGMHYRASRALQFTLHGGTSKNSDLDTIIRGKVSYTF